MEMELSDIVKRIKKIYEEEDIKNSLFRLGIVSSEIGDLAKYLTHDPKINPDARPFGSREDEKLAFGEALVQLIGLGISREIDIYGAIEKGLENWENRDWKKSDRSNIGKGYISGEIGCKGYVKGPAFLDPDLKRIEKIKKENILVTKYAKPDVSIYLKSISGIVTDHGTRACHAAIIAREYNIPCVVGTGDATKIIKNEQIIEIDKSIVRLFE